MSGKPGPTIRRWQLGHELAEHRAAARVSAKDAAAEIEVTAGTLSKIEGGRQSIKPMYVKLLAMRYGLSDEKRDELLGLAHEANQPGYWVTYSKLVPDWFRLFLGYEHDASTLQAYESELVPGLLQTPDYIRAILLAGNPTATDEWLANQIELRLLRQQTLIDANPPSFHAVLNEAVLLRLVGGKDVMTAQLRALAKAAEQHTIQVLPFSAGAHPAMTAPFLLLGFDEEPRMNTVYLENGRGSLYLDRKSDLDSYSAKFEQITRLALSPEDSLSHLVSLTRNL
ncbi:helix-turn-helix domain-containing protein [Lentzea albida]|uniref:Helix-turn-helix domain-containing protein n=1 Tax=Lentzea albida TaxID=65499 RepID=A0A1H9VGX0_9PSEU|nr:helix-turn-helix transcriptional regulator [Lentzea albida]SES20714.1 Helix-turn-helix domain-containing protein [Lentzea albida]